MQNKQKGDRGEKIAVRELIKNGYDILETNYRCKFGEIDIIAKREGCIAFVEVKLRSGLKTGYPGEAVDRRKQQKIKLTAQNYIGRYNIENMNFRFDVAEIIMTDKIYFRYIENAF